MKNRLKWIVENYTDSSDYRDLIKEIKDSGRKCHVIEKKNHFDVDFSVFKDKELVLFQGSIGTLKRAREALTPKNCYPIGFCNDSAFECRNYYPFFEGLLFNDKYETCSVSYLKQNCFDYYRRFGKEAILFLRPDRGDKPFTGQLLDLQDFDRFWLNNVVCNAENEDIVLVSTPKTVNGEWRFVVTDKKEIITQSTYMYQGQSCLIPVAPEGATKKVKEILERGYYPDPIFCIDIVEDNDGNFWLLELTSFSSAGLYSTNKKKIVERVSEICENL